VVSGRQECSGPEERLSQTKFYGKKQNCFWIENFVASPMYYSRICSAPYLIQILLLVVPLFENIG